MWMAPRWVETKEKESARNNEHSTVWEDSSTTQDGFGEKRFIRRGPPGTVSLYNESLFGRWGVAKTDPICPGEDVGQRFLGLGQKHRLALARKVVGNLPLFSPSSVVIGSLL